jgi:hypothetical protein
MASCSSLTTGRSPVIRVPTSAPSARRWRRSCGPARSRRPWFARTAWAGHRRPTSPSASNRLAMCLPMPAQPLDRPDPIPPPFAVAEHRGVAVTVGAEPATTVNASSAVITSIVAERLCGSIPITTRPGMRSDLDTINFSNARSTTGYRGGRATLLRVRQTLLEPLLALATSGPRRPNESHTINVGSRKERRAGRQDRVSPAPVLGAIQQAAGKRARQARSIGLRFDA